MCEISDKASSFFRKNCFQRCRQHCGQCLDTVHCKLGPSLVHWYLWSQQDVRSFQPLLTPPQTAWCTLSPVSCRQNRQFFPPMAGTALRTGGAHINLAYPSQHSLGSVSFCPVEFHDTTSRCDGKCGWPRCCCCVGPCSSSVAGPCVGMHKMKLAVATPSPLPTALVFPIEAAIQASFVRVVVQLCQHHVTH